MSYMYIGDPNDWIKNWAIGKEPRELTTYLPLSTATCKPLHGMYKTQEYPGGKNIDESTWVTTGDLSKLKRIIDTWYFPGLFLQWVIKVWNIWYMINGGYRIKKEIEEKFGKPSAEDFARRRADEYGDIMACIGKLDPEKEYALVVKPSWVVFDDRDAEMDIDFIFGGVERIKAGTPDLTWDERMEIRREYRRTPKAQWKSLRYKYFGPDKNSQTKVPDPPTSTEPEFFDMSERPIHPDFIKWREEFKKEKEQSPQPAKQEK